LSILGLFGYFTGLVELDGLAPYTKIAVNTIGTFIILSLGMFLTGAARQRASITIEQKFFAGLIFVASLVIFVAQLSFSGIDSLLNASEWIEHTQQVKQQLTSVLLQTVDMETGTRGFVITGEDSYAEPLRKASAELPNLLKNLSVQTSDNPRQQKALTLLGHLVNERIEVADRLCQTRRSQGLEKAISLLVTGKGKIITDSIRVLLASMTAEESRLMTTRYSNEKERSIRTQKIIYISLAIQMVLIAFMFVIVRKDVTGRRKSEESLRKLNEELEKRVKERTEALQKSEEQNRLMIEGVRDYAILMLDVGGQVTNWNKGGERINGYNSDEIIGKHFSRFYTTEDIQSGKPALDLEAAIAEGRYEIEGWRMRKDGSRFWASVIITAIYDMNGQLLGFSQITKDETERKRNENELTKAKAEAERANVAKGEFLSRMSHELRTPMNSILGFAQLMDMGELNPVQKKGVNQILKNGKHLLDLINEVLDIARIEAGRMTVSTEPVELRGIIMEAMDVLRHLAEENQITLESDTSTAAKRLFVRADHQRLKQVLLNLINNAVKYNRKGGSVKIESRILKNESKKEQPANIVRISITDTGKGITREDIEKLFNPFERIGADKAETEGTGLGLSISKKLIEAMGGKIGVESEVGSFPAGKAGGSTFWIELPQTESQKDQYERVSELTKPENEITLNSGIILYIEDNLSNIQLVEQILETHRPSINLITEMFGKKAVQFALDYKPDLILLDLDLPDIHGSEVLKLLRAEPDTEAIPVIILSADAMTKQIKRLMQAGAKDYLIKPIDVVQFLKIVDGVIGKSSKE